MLVSCLELGFEALTKGVCFTSSSVMVGMMLDYNYVDLQVCWALVATTLVEFFFGIDVGHGTFVK